MIGGWFITGTDTGVGKTAVAESLLFALAETGRRAAGFKPVASGCRNTAFGLRSEDAERLAAASIPLDYADVNPYAFEPAVAPHIAAARAGVEMHVETVRRHFAVLAAKADWIVAEGAGGWYVPFNRTLGLHDVACALALPVLLVVGIRLGCISHALLTARAVRTAGLPLAGWVATVLDPAFDAAEESVTALRERLDAPWLATIPHGTIDEQRRYGAVVLRRLLSARS